MSVQLDNPDEKLDAGSHSLCHAIIRATSEQGGTTSTAAEGSGSRYPNYVMLSEPKMLLLLDEEGHESRLCCLCHYVLHVSVFKNEIYVIHLDVYHVTCLDISFMFCLLMLLFCLY